MKKLLTIAGSDSGGCAGIQADIKAGSACGVFVTSAITAVTSQNTTGVTYVKEMTVESIETQLDAVLSDIGTDAVKSGMLFSKDIITIVGEKLRRYVVDNYVLDPVMVSSSGSQLLKSDAVDALITHLIPISLLITPNIPEAETLTGMKIKNQDDVDKACKYILEMGAKNVLIKGGHFEGDQSSDTLYDGNNYREYTSARIDTKNTHGTGCSYSAAIGAYLAKGLPLPDAVGLAKQYITTAIKYGSELKIGEGAGPVHHFFMIGE